MKEQIQILEDLRPWDCEIFPESKTICYGGGGGPKINLTPPSLPKPPVIKAPTFNVPEVNMPHVSVPDITGMNLTPSQGNLDALSSFGENVTGALEKNIGQDSALGQNLQANLGGLREGIDHNIKQVGIGGQMIGGMLQKLFNPAKGGGGAGGGGGAMGPRGMLLGSTRGRDIKKQRGGLSRKKTMLTG